MGKSTTPELKMLTRWKLSNFRCFREATELELGRLTLLAGPSNAGKSTIIKSILMVAQSLSSPGGSRLVLNGPLVKLDRPRAICSDRIRSKGEPDDEQPPAEIGIGWECEPMDFRQGPQVNLCQPDKEKRPPVSQPAKSRDLHRLQQRLSVDITLGFASNSPLALFGGEMLPVRYRLTAAPADDSQAALTFAASLPVKDPDDEDPDAFLRRIGKEEGGTRKYTVEIDEETRAELDRQPGERQLTGCTFKGLMPGLLTLGPAEPAVSAAEESTATAGTAAPGPTANGSPGETGNWLPRRLLQATFQTRTVFSRQLKYLGPLRDDPVKFQPVTEAPDNDSVGVRGERTAALYFHRLRDEVTFMPPENFDAAEIKLTARTATLMKAASAWLGYLGVCDSIYTMDGGHLGHSIGVRISPDDPPRALSEVGVGVSQVIPVVIACLLAQPDTTLIFEQPEQHLHPQAQARLADLFLATILMKKQCLVETHSEHLLDRLRLRVAALDGPAGDGATGSAGSLGSLVKAYFVEKTPAGSQVRGVPAGRFGSLTGWPEGFFDHSQRQAGNILRLTEEAWEPALGSDYFSRRN